MMKISRAEQLGIQEVLAYAEAFGYGSLISHLQTAWAKKLVMEDGLSEKAARAASGGPGYPFAMHDDLVDRGEWGETGKRYRQPTPRLQYRRPKA